ncbi:MAG: trigger factor [Acidobacteria bacterium]|nr:trigger factor [Acidobacteriota bacterium]
MQVTLTHHTPTRKSVEVRVPAPEVAATFQEVITRMAPKVKIPGFRPGKAPKTVLLKRFGREIESEVAQSLVQRLFWDAAAAAGTQPISQPALENATVKEGEEGQFKVHYDVAPEVTLPPYSSIKLVKQKRRIDAEAVEEHLEGLRQRSAKFIPVEGVAEVGHYATLDLKVKPQGMKSRTYKDQVVQLDPSRPFDAQILGMGPEEEKAFDIPVPLEDPNKAVAGKKIHHEVRLKDLRRREVPELNDDFARDLGAFDDLKALRAAVARDLEEAAERDAQARLQSRLLDGLLDAAPFEVPTSMVALQLDDYCQEFAQEVSQQGVDPKRINWAAYRQHRLRDAERAVRSGYLLQAIGNAEDIQVSEDEIDADIRGYMEENKIQTPFPAFKADLERRGSTTEIKGRIRTDKIFEKLLASAQVSEEILDKEAFVKLVELERKRQAGEPVSRFDAGGLEGGELETQEGGDPVEAEHVHGPDCDHDHEAEKPRKKASKAKESSPEGEEKPKARKAKKAE